MAPAGRDEALSPKIDHRRLALVNTLNIDEWPHSSDAVGATETPRTWNCAINLATNPVALTSSTKLRR